MFQVALPMEESILFSLDSEQQVLLAALVPSLTAKNGLNPCICRD
jgi:hypothetical protein